MPRKSLVGATHVFRLSVVRFWLWAGLLYVGGVLALYLLVRLPGRSHPDVTVRIVRTVRE